MREKKRKVLLTGASGFVGRQILEELLRHDVNINLVVRQSNLKKIKKSKKISSIFYTNNLFKESDLWFNQVTKDIDIVIHSAWYVKVKDYTTSLENINCFIGTKKLAQFCKKNKVKKFIGLGTCLEYDLSKRYLSIETPLNPKSLYAQTKVKTYKYLYKYFNNSNTEFNWHRLFYLYGDGQHKKKLFSLINDKLKKNKKVLLTNGNQIRDYINVKKAAKIIVKNSMSNKSPEVINVCSGKGIKVKDFAIKIAKKYNKIHLLKFSKSKDKNIDEAIIVGVK